MSLIQEALKRKREEEALRPPEEAAPPQETTPEVPAAETIPEPSSKRPLFITLSFVIVLILLLLGALKLLRADKTPVQVEIVETTPAIKAPIPSPPPVIEEEPEPGTQWPELTLTGFASGAGQRMVIINGKMLSQGRSIDGARVIQIGRNGVVVEYQGERKTLYTSE